MTVSYEEFSKLNIRIAQITQAEPIANTDKLLKLTITLGDESRQLVAGLAKAYKPEELIDQQIVVLENLEPKTIRGTQSQGMLLAADVNGQPILLMPQKPVPNGAKVR